MRLLNGEQVANIAVGVDLFQPPPGRDDAPAQRTLAQVPARREMQALHAILHRSLVAIARLVPNVHVHALSLRRGNQEVRCDATAQIVELRQKLLQEVRHAHAQEFLHSREMQHGMHFPGAPHGFR